MRKAKKVSRPKIGRPPIGAVKVTVSMLPLDVVILRRYGLGSLSLGIRRAAANVRNKEE